MAGTDPLRVCLDFAPGMRPVSGRLHLPGQPDRGFAGWTELFAALEATLQGPPAEQSGESDVQAP